MSCNGCRVLRKGCSEGCTLRACLQWIESSEAQGHATVFVAKFFGRAGLMSFVNAVPENERPALFQSLLFEACGRTVNPVYGATGLMWAGKWHICQAAVERVLKGEPIHPHPPPTTDRPIHATEASENTAESPQQSHPMNHVATPPTAIPMELELTLSPTHYMATSNSSGGRSTSSSSTRSRTKSRVDINMPRVSSPSINSEGSVTSTTRCTHPSLLLLPISPPSHQLLDLLRWDEMR